VVHKGACIVVSSTPSGSRDTTKPHRIDGDYPPTLPDMMECGLQHGSRDIFVDISQDYFRMPPMPLSLSQLGITSPGHLARYYPFTGPIPGATDTDETQADDKSLLQHMGESQMPPL
jgi:hypothetical protein